MVWGILIFEIYKRFSLCKPTYAILDENKQPLLKVIGPCFTCEGICCACEKNFRVNKNIFSIDG